MEVKEGASVGCGRLRLHGYLAVRGHKVPLSVARCAECHLRDSENPFWTPIDEAFRVSACHGS